MIVGHGGKTLEVGDLAAQDLGPGAVEDLRGGLRAGQGEDGVAVAEQLGDHRGANGAGATGDEDVHVKGLLWSDGTTVASP